MHITPEGLDKVYDGDELEDTYRPATTHKEPILKLCGTHVITQHYYGAYYQRTITFTLRSETAHQKMKAQGALGTINLDTAWLGTLSTSDIGWHYESKQQGFIRLLDFLRTHGYETLVTMFENREDVMVGASNVNAIFTAARALYQVLVQIERATETLQCNGVDFSSVLSVIAVRPENHGRACHQQEGVSILDLEKATTHAWRACAEKLGRIEKKKAKKVDKGIL